MDTADSFQKQEDSNLSMADVRSDSVYDSSNMEVRFLYFI